MTVHNQSFATLVLFFVFVFGVIFIQDNMTGVIIVLSSFLVLTVALLAYAVTHSDLD